MSSRSTAFAYLLGPALRWLYASIVLLGIAVGAETSVLALYLRSASISPERIGSLAVAFAAGGVAVAVPLGRLRVGAKRTLVFGLVVLGLAIASLPLLVRSTPALVLGRFIGGASMVAVWIGYEAALFSRSPPDQRAMVSSLYAIVLALGYVVGPVVARAFLASGVAASPFWGASILTVANGLAVHALVSDAPTEPSPDAAESSGAWPFAALAFRVKTSALAMFAAGYLKASLVMFLPLYLVDHRGVSADETPLALSAYAAGALAFTHFAGRLGDRRGHLRVMATLAAAGGVTMLGFSYARAFSSVCAIALVAGATLGAISPLSMALQASIVPKAEYSRAMSLSNGLYAAGTLVGPFVTGLAYARWPRTAMLQVAVMWIAFAIVAALWADDDPARGRGRARG